MPKLKVDFKNGLVEVEGDEALVKEVYADYKEVLSGLIAARQYTEPAAALSAGKDEDESAKKPNKKAKKQKSKSQSKSKSTHKIVSDLNLLPADKQSFKDFFSDKSGGNKLSAQEFNLVAVYYLKKVLNVQGVSADHVYTCYKEAGQIVPTALVQSLKDTASLKGWISTSKTDDIKIEIAGENEVEHRMPKIKSK
jgi:hypothetical protein